MPSTASFIAKTARMQTAMSATAEPLRRRDMQNASPVTNSKKKKSMMKLFKRYCFIWVCGIGCIYGRTILNTSSLLSLRKAFYGKGQKKQTSPILLEALPFSFEGRQGLASESWKSCWSSKYLKVERYWKDWLYQGIWSPPASNRYGEKNRQEADLKRNYSPYRREQAQQPSRQFAISYSI